MDDVTADQEEGQPAVHVDNEREHLAGRVDVIAVPDSVADAVRPGQLERLVVHVDRTEIVEVEDLDVTWAFRIAI